MDRCPKSIRQYQQAMTTVKGVTETPAIDLPNKNNLTLPKHIMPSSRQIPMPKHIVPRGTTSKRIRTLTPTVELYPQLSPPMQPSAKYTKIKAFSNLLHSLFDQMVITLLTPQISLTTTVPAQGKH
jgi:hypothetical protein